MPSRAHLMVADGDELFPGDILAKIPRETTRTKDITGGLPRVVELFEARKPHDPAIISKIDGVVRFGEVAKGQRKVYVTADNGQEEEYTAPSPPCPASSGSRSTRRSMARRGEAAALGIPAIALFPYTDPALRDEAGSEALNPENLVCRALERSSRRRRIGLITDVALDPYTSHGHDGLLRGDEILNDETVAVLVAQALNQAHAGADIIAPSDMMDGRVGAIRAGARRGRLRVRADFVLRREICLGFLRPLPRRHRHEGDADRRQAHLSDGPGQFGRSAARGRARYRCRAPISSW